MKQLMTPLPALRLKNYPVWHFSMLDLFGPINVKDFVNQRTTRKTWEVIITCLTTRACQAYLAESFSTDQLLCVLRKHEVRNGSPFQPSISRTWEGRLLALTEFWPRLQRSWTKLSLRGCTASEVKFNCGTPHFPAEQGAVDRLVQELKKNLKIITSGTMGFGELDTALAEASYLVNCRPMQPSPAMGEDSFICPNDIIKGRSDKLPPLAQVFDNNLTGRMAHIQRIISDFWSKWSSSYYQTLVKYHRWRLKTRNAEPGDVILVLDRERPKGKFTLGRISTVQTDADNIVRKVTIKYELPLSGLNHDLVPSA